MASEEPQVLLEGFVTLGITTGFAHALQSGRAFREARAEGMAPWWYRIARLTGIAGFPFLIVWLLVRLPFAAAGLYLLGAALWALLLLVLLPPPDSPIYRESFQGNRRAAADPSPPRAPRPPRTAAAKKPTISTVAHEVDRRRMRLHCRFCGNPVSKPLRETPETPTHPPGCYTWLYRRGCELSWLGHKRADPEVGVVMVKRQDLDGSVLPLEHHAERIGCCGFPGGYEPNIKCHGCGHWILVDVEDCQASAMTAARTKEIELRPAP